jgi:demethylmenaquinone methyltransferase/2-methoxy-6-polyprenyl-1,4-benzoquinol methylase
MDKQWRLRAARECLADKPKRMLDLACGTGDLAITIAKITDSVAEITGLDFSEPMLAKAQQKAQAAGKNVAFINGDATNLPFPDGYFDCVGISFAFRNLTYRHVNAAKHLAEVLRVLCPGGRFVIVESSQPENRFVRKLDHLYLRTFVYWLGWCISGNRNAYRYLSSSAANYYSAEELKDVLLKAGFSQVSFRRLFFGAAAIHVAIK